MLEFGFDQRAIKTATTSTDFLYDTGGHLIAEANDAGGAMIWEYIWMDDKPVAMVDDTAAPPAVSKTGTRTDGIALERRPSKVLSRNGGSLLRRSWRSFSRPRNSVG